MNIGTTVKFPGIVNLPVSSTTTVDTNGNLISTVKRGQCLKFVGGIAVPCAAAADNLVGYALSDSDQINLVVPVYISAVTVEMLVKTGDNIALGDLLYSTGDGTVSHTPTASGAIGVAVNPSYAQTTVEMALLDGTGAGGQAAADSLAALKAAVAGAADFAALKTAIAAL
jgi:hypothetical protein